MRGNDWDRAMRAGDFERAWDICDAVLARRIAEGPCWMRPRHEQWIWDGRPLEGRNILIRCYHGLGDTIQFARFLPRIARRAASLTIWAQPALLPLLDAMGQDARLLPLHEGSPDAEYDVDLEIMETAHALRVTVDALSAEVPYFDVPPEPRLSNRFCVGVVAGAGPWDARRAVPPDLFAELGRLSGIDVYNLQPGGCIPGARDASVGDVMAAASRVRALDLVITVDTMMSHLAGALGVPTWTLLQAEADWRWMDGRRETPWYPSMRLFRQLRPGDWRPVLDEVRESLLAASR